MQQLKRHAGTYLDLRNQVNQHENDLAQHSDPLKKISEALPTEQSSRLAELVRLREFEGNLGGLLTEFTARMEEIGSEQVRWEEQAKRMGENFKFWRTRVATLAL